MYIGHEKHDKYRKVVKLIKKELQEIEDSASDAVQLAKALFVILFKDELDTNAENVCCTKYRDSRQLLDQDILAGTRCEQQLNCTVKQFTYIPVTREIQ